jgi:hypothetical protein
MIARLLLAAVAMTVSNAFATEQVQFNILIETGVCTLSDINTIKECVGGYNPINETVKVNLTKQNGNDHADFEKTYTLKRSDTGEDMEVVLDVIVSDVTIDHDTMYSVETHLSPKNGSRTDDRSGFVSAKSGAALSKVDIELHGKGELHTAQDGKLTEASATVFISGVSIPEVIK